MGIPLFEAADPVLRRHWSTLKVTEEEVDDPRLLGERIHRLWKLGTSLKGELRADPTRASRLKPILDELFCFVTLSLPA